MKNIQLCIILILLTQVACTSLKVSEQKPINTVSLYQQAITNSMLPDSSKIFANLIPINKQNQNLKWKEINGEDYILVVTWKQNISYFKQYKDSTYYNTGNYSIWVTAAPELLQRMKTGSNRDINLRLKQLLGLPPNTVYSYFVEFWVKPADLFRPCPDKEINDNICELCFPEKADSAHISWINKLRIESYYQCNLYSKYPWTQLGYTYDWNPENKSHVGLSEFIIGTNKKIIVEAIYDTEEYLKK